MCDDVEAQALVRHQSVPRGRLADADVGQQHVAPSGEEVEPVPHALAVAEHHHRTGRRHRRSSAGHRTIAPGERRECPRCRPVPVRSLPPVRRAHRGAPRVRRGELRPRLARAVRHVTRGTCAVAGDGHRRVDRRARHEAGALGRRQHPLGRGDGRRRRAVPPPSPRLAVPRRRCRRSSRRCAHGRSTSCRASIPTASSRRWPASPRYRRSSMRPWPWRDGHQWPGLVERRHRRRRARPVDADRRSARRVDRAPRRRAGDDARCPPTGSSPDGTADTGCSNEGTLTDYDGFTIPTPRRGRGTRPQPQLPGGLGHRCARDPATIR